MRGTCTRVGRINLRPRGALTASALAVTALLAFAPCGLAGTPNTWAETGAMSVARGAPASALLPGGKVLVAGGQTNLPGNPPTSHAEIYDPATSSWTEVAPMNVARNEPTAVSLADGKVLVVGGQGSGPGVGNSAEVYDPVANTWTTATNNLSLDRGQFPVAVHLGNGHVVVANGYTVPASSTVDNYDPATNSFSASAPMGTARSGPSGILLPNGKVLIAGGGGASAVLASAEVYNPSTNSWSGTANNMSSPRALAGISTMRGGKVLIVSGLSGSNPSLSTTPSVDVYEPATNSFSSAAALSQGRILFAQTELADGRVLVAGGALISGATQTVIATTEVYDPGSGTWSPAGSLNEPRAAQAQVLLGNGTVLDAGGISSASGTSASLASAELFTPTSAPGAPQGVSATAGNHQASVTWAPPASDGGATVRHYRITASTGQSLTTPDGRTSATMIGLPNGRAVSFSVTATNTVGTSAPSARSNAVIPGPPQITVSGVSSHLSLKSFLKGVSLKVKPNQAVSLDVSLLAAASKATIARVYNLTLVRRTLGLSSATRTIKLVANRKLLGRAAKFKAEVLVIATNSSGARTTVTKTLTISGARKKKGGRR